MKKYIDRVWVDDSAVYASTEDGLVACYEFSMWPLLANATAEQRADFQLSYSGIHWPQVDEDLSFGGMFIHSNSGNPGDIFVYEDLATGVVAEETF